MSVNLLIKPFWILGIDRGVQNAVGYEAYGVYYELFAFSMYLIALLDLGLNTYMSSNVARNPQTLRDNFTAVTTFKLSASAVYFGLTLSLGYLSGYNSYRLSLLLILGFNQVLSYFYTYFRSITAGLQMFKQDAILSIVDRSLMIIICGLLLWAGIGEMSIERFIYAQTFSYLIAAGVALWVIRHHLSNLNWKPNLAKLTEVVKEMAPYTLLTLLMTLYTRLDATMLRTWAIEGDKQVGIYASAYRLLEAGNMMAALVAMLLLPIFSKMLAEKQSISPLVQFSTGLMVVPAFAFCVVAFFWQFPLIQLLNYQSNAYAGNVFGLVMLCFFPLSIMYVYGTLLTANRSLKTLNLFAIIALVGNIGLNYLLIPKYQALGAAISALITHGFIGITNFIWGIKIVQIRFDPSFLLKLASSLLLTFVVAFALNASQLPWIAGAICTGLCAVSCLFFLKIIRFSDIFLLLKQRSQ